MVDGEPTAGPVRVLLVDDHQMFVESLGRLLATHPGIDVVAVATTSAAGVAAAAESRPDVVLVDYDLPDGDGVSTAIAIRTADPEVMVVMLTGSADDRVLLAAIDAGCTGFITKDRAADEVIDAVLRAAAGEPLITTQQLAQLLPQLTARRRPGPALTEREQELLLLIAEGLTNKAIAGRLNLSIHTVRNYVQQTLTKLGAHSKLEAVATAVRAGLIRFPPAEP